MAGRITDEKGTQGYDDALNDVVLAWMEYAVPELQNEIRKKKLVLTGELLDSVSMQFKNKFTNGAAVVELLFANSGRFAEIQKMDYSKPANFAAIKAYVERVGLGSFSKVPGYDVAQKVPSTDVAINRIAWGIAFARQKSQGSRGKRKAWFNNAWHKRIMDRLLDDIVEATGTAALNSVLAELPTEIQL